MKFWTKIGLGMTAALLVLVGSAGWLVETAVSPAPSCAIVVISGDSGDRIRKGINLYHQGWAPKLILSGSDRTGDRSSAHNMRLLAEHRGVPASQIIVEPLATNTFENAQNVHQILRGLPCPERQILLVTSGYHSRRAALVFENELQNLRLQVRSVPAAASDWNPKTWWQTRRGWYLTMSELAKLFYMKTTGRPER